jgi:hypothetical protein
LGKEIWPLLLEKAFCKKMGSYANAAGFTIKMLKFITIILKLYNYIIDSDVDLVLDILTG